MADTAAPKIGRPSIYSDELAERLCERIAAGELLTRIEREDGMPNYATVYRWLEKNTAFRELYARAREIGWSRLAEQIVELSDDSRGDVIIEDGETRVDHENVQRSRLMVDTRKWLLSKVLPKIYGDKLALTDGDGKPFSIQVVRYDLPAQLPGDGAKVINQPAAHSAEAANQVQVIEKKEGET